MGERMLPAEGKETHFLSSSKKYFTALSESIYRSRLILFKSHSVPLQHLIGQHGAAEPAKQCKINGHFSGLMHVLLQLSISTPQIITDICVCIVCQICC